MEKRGKKVAIIDNSLDPFLYDPTGHWSSYLDVEWKSFRATKGHLPDLREGFTHLILTGSEASILERENWVYEEADLVQEALDKGLAILGSCWGHQLLAFILCGADYVRRSPQPEVGWIAVQIKKDNSLLGKKKQAYSFSLHFDEVVNLGNDFDTLASSKYCQVQAFQWKNGAVWGFQIHPEIDIRGGQIFLKKLISLRLQTTAYFEEALRQRPKDSGLIHLIVRNFIASNCKISSRNK